MYHRNATVSKEEVAMVFIALHRPISAEFAMPLHVPSHEKQLDVAYG
jgi:hypothetical protein